MPMPAGRTPFVGRERELATLLACLDAASRGAGGVVMVAGEPGIGKTRLLAEFADRARATGWQVLAGRAYDTEGLPPYLPFLEALRDPVRTASAEALLDDDGLPGDAVQQRPARIVIGDQAATSRCSRWWRTFRLVRHLRETIRPRIQTQASDQVALGHLVTLAQTVERGRGRGRADDIKQRASHVVRAPSAPPRPTGCPRHRARDSPRTPETGAARPGSPRSRQRPPVGAVPPVADRAGRHGSWFFSPVRTLHPPLESRSRLAVAPDATVPCGTCTSAAAGQR